MLKNSCLKLLDVYVIQLIRIFFKGLHFRFMFSVSKKRLNYLSYAQSVATAVFVPLDINQWNSFLCPICVWSSLDFGAYLQSAFKSPKINISLVSNSEIISYVTFSNADISSIALAGFVCSPTSTNSEITDKRNKRKISKIKKGYFTLKYKMLESWRNLFLFYLSHITRQIMHILAIS